MDLRRKTIFLLLISFMISSSKLRADDAPIGFVQGGTVKPINNNEIQLYSETIDITLYKDYYAVEVNYIFKNKGKAQEVVMGFPSNSASDSLCNFKAYANDVELKTFDKETDWSYTPPELCNAVNYYPPDRLNLFVCHKVYFQRKETKKIKNTYKQRYNEDYGESEDIFFHYILKTGAFWKGKISLAEVRVHAENLPYYFDIQDVCFNNESVSLENFYRKFTDFEPTEDLNFRVRPKAGLVAVHASSTLPADDSCNYELSNLFDGDTTTAWIEATGGYSIDEEIIFHNFYDVTKLCGIGIVNGYAKSKQTFDEHCKVYCLEIEGWRGGINAEYSSINTEREPDRIVYSFILDDIMEMQYLHFKYPIYATDLSVKIVSKYHIRKANSRYKEDDPEKKTAISEIVFLYDEDK